MEALPAVCGKPRRRGMPLFFLSDPTRFPKVGNAERAAIGLERWREATAETGDSELAAFATTLAEDEAGRRLLEAVFGNSPYLSQCLLRDIGFARTLIRRGPEATLARLLAGLKRLAARPTTSERAMKRLRIAKRRTALITALADITGVWPLERVTGALTAFAEAALGVAVAHLLREAAAQGALTLPDPARPGDGSGFIVLGMGKLGGRELNYSSDIDLVVLYDEERIETANADGLQQCFVRLTRDLIRTMEERTAEGYVFRTDLRLRPDPGLTPLALSVLAAETYYETTGQNWERAAMIKARPVAGDAAAGSDFLDRLKPFLWRKHLDFAAIQDIHSIKRQIDAHRGGREIAGAGHNIKLGPGGIRAIELFVQTQQLIWGGRDPSLRVAGTCEAMRALAAAGRVRPEVADQLIADYRFLRTVEHRLQMVDDKQTHTLPSDGEGFKRFAAFLGYGEAEDFERELVACLRRIEGHYAELFEGAPPLAAPGNLVFTGVEHDPETLNTLRKLGFEDAQMVSTIVRGWHHGRYRATRSTRAREILTELMPGLLSALSKTANPDAAFRKFDDFLSGLPAGVQLLSLFYANPGLVDLVAEIMGGAPRLAEHLSRDPAALDAVLESGFFDPPPDSPVLAAALEQALEQARDFWDVLDITRRWTHERKFQVGVQMLRNVIDAEAAGAALSDITDTVVAALLPIVETEFARRHGRIADGGLAVIALGKLGGREMTPSSDIDLIFVYDAPDAASTAASSGAKPLPAGQYFARLSQRLLNAITSLTGEGRLYEVDMRLRPAGGAGPIASSLEGFLRYQRESAWTWEHMALTRARVIAGPPELAARAGEAIRQILTAPRDPARLLVDVADMRARMEREHRPQSIWDVKHLRGGFVDVEFVAQYLELRHAHDHPEVLSTNTTEALERIAAAGLLDAAVAADLIAATRLWRRVQAMLRLTVAGAFAEEAAPEGLRAVLAKAAGEVDFAGLKAKIVTTAERSHEHFAALVETPAAAHREKLERRQRP